MSTKAKRVSGNIFIYLSDPGDPCPSHMYAGGVSIEAGNFDGVVADENGNFIKVSGFQSSVATVIELEQGITIVLSKKYSFPEEMQIPSNIFSFSGVYGLKTDDITSYVKKAGVLSVLKI